jgi:hypothetical protein
MAMPRPTPSVIRRAHGSRSALMPHASRPSSGVRLQEEQCLGPNETCARKNPMMPCLMWDPVLNLVFCNACCTP